MRSAVMPLQRRLWDSSVIIGYLAGDEAVYEPCRSIIEQAERGELEIVVSALAAAEVAFLERYPQEESEDIIREFFGRRYIVLVAVDARMAAVARSLVSRYRKEMRIKPADAIHLATAVQLSLPVLETTDSDLLRFSGLEGNPSVVVREPLYEGPMRIPGLD